MAVESTQTQAEGRRSRRSARLAAGTHKMWNIPVPLALAAEVEGLAAAQRRSITQQIIWMLEESLRRSQEQRRRAEDHGEAQPQRVGAA